MPGSGQQQLPNERERVTQACEMARRQDWDGLLAWATAESR
jgi:hypothetical protein